MSAKLRPGLTVNRTDLANLLGVSLPTIDAMVRRGCPFVHRGSKGREWSFDSATVIEWLRQGDVEDILDEVKSDDLRSERIALLRQQRRRLELDNAAREATTSEFDFQDAVISVLASYWTMNSRRISTLVFNDLQQRGLGTQATEIAGLVHGWILGTRVEIEDELKRASAEGRKRGLGLSSFDALQQLITKATGSMGAIAELNGKEPEQ